MPKSVLIITIIIIFGILLSACGSPAPAEPMVSVEENTAIESPEGAMADESIPAISIVDGLGRQVTLESPAMKIVTLSPPITEILFAVGAGDQVIGRDSFSDYPEDALSLPDIGGGFSEYDLETIIALEPDLVIAGGINTPELVQSLEDLGLTVYYMANPADLDGTFNAIQNLGIISGREETASELVNTLETRKNAVTEALAGVEEKPYVYYELDATAPSKPFTPGANTFYSSMIDMAGAENIGDTLESEWAQISLEQLLVEDPDLILLGDAMWGITPESVAERAGWGSLTAVKEDKVFPFDDNLIARIGPRQIDGLEALAAIFHPDLFD